METKMSGELVELKDARGAANEELKPEAPEPSTAAAVEVSGGWDPYEVWRTRIKSARDTRLHGDTKRTPR